jgi:hypothetical protein
MGLGCDSENRFFGIAMPLAQLSTSLTYIFYLYDVQLYRVDLEAA